MHWGEGASPPQIPRGPEDPQDPGDPPIRLDLSQPVQILRSSDPPILRSSGPQVLRSSGPQVLRSSDPQILRFLRSSDPQVLRSSDSSGFLRFLRFSSDSSGFPPIPQVLRSSRSVSTFYLPTRLMPLPDFATLLYLHLPSYPYLPTLFTPF